MTAAAKPGAPPAQVGAPGLSQAAPSARAWYALGVIVVTAIFGYLDRQIFVLLVGPIKHDLSLRDVQIGVIQGLGPVFFAALASIPLAWLADRIERRTVLCGCILFWSIATAACGLATSFTALFVCTISVGIGEACLSPIIYSLIPDLFPEKSRPLANIITYAATALASGLGLAIGGALLGLVGDLRALLPASLHERATWRLAFFLVAIPGPLIAIAAFLIGATRRVVMTADGPAPVARIGRYMREHGAVVLGVYGSIGCLGVALVAIGSWLPIALIRTFHVPAASVGVGFGSVVMAGSAVGMVGAAIMAPYWRRVAGTVFVLRVFSFASAGAAVPTILLCLAGNIWQAYALVFCFAAIAVTGPSLMPGLMQDIAPAALRARVIAVGMVMVMIGGAISPVIVGIISDKLSGNPRGLILAIAAVAVVGFALCATLTRLMEGSYRRTVAAVAVA